MTQQEFKNKIDNREDLNANRAEMWEEAYNWEDLANEEDKTFCKWRWDCGFKLDFDGDLCYISSRFYPPHKHHEDYTKWSGSITVYIGDSEASKTQIEAQTLDELKTLAEEHVLSLESKIKESIKATLS